MAPSEWKAPRIITRAEPALKTQPSETGKPISLVRTVLPASWFEAKENNKAKKEAK